MKRLLLIVLPLLFMVGCEDGKEGAEGSDGLNILVLTEVEPAGSNCVNGGTKVSFGYDNDVNGILESTEVSTSTYICNGEDGNDGDDGVANINVQVLPLMASDWTFVDTNGDGVGRMSAGFGNADLTLDVVNNGMVLIELSYTNNPPYYNSLPMIYYGDFQNGGDVDYIVDCYFSYSVGEITINWSASDNPTASQWLSNSAIYSGYYKITTILPN
jgi:hypothetical protein